jgi:hypothetical protein
MTLNSAVDSAAKEHNPASRNQRNATTDFTDGTDKKRQLSHP